MLYEADHVGSAFHAVEAAASEGQSFDVVHDHSGFTAMAMAPRSPVPVVHTLHAPFDEETAPFYARHDHKEMVPNPIRVADWPFRIGKDEYLLWVGRFDPVKGAHRAISVARRAGFPLVLAGPVQHGQEPYFKREIEPHIDGEQVRYVGEVGGDRRMELFAGAKALPMPIRWAEPFGLVMIEALVCGTPVLAFPEGAVGEIVIDGEKRLPGGRRAADDRSDRPDRGNRPVPLSRKRRFTLQRPDHRRTVRGCLRASDPRSGGTLQIHRPAPAPSTRATSITQRTSPTASDPHVTR